MARKLRRLLEAQDSLTGQDAGGLVPDRGQAADREKGRLKGMTTEAPTFLAHKSGDAVAVAVRDVEPGEETVGFLDEAESRTVQVRSSIPLGHKVALSGVAAGADVVEYGVRIGVATTDIAEGDYVHTHNVRSARWQTSAA